MKSIKILSAITLTLLLSMSVQAIDHVGEDGSTGIDHMGEDGLSSHQLQIDHVGEDGSTGNKSQVDHVGEDGSTDGEKSLNLFEKLFLDIWI